MQIRRSHNVTQKEAKSRIDNFLDGLMRREFPGGVKIVNPSKFWSGNTMMFSFGVKKTIFINISLSGTIRIDDHSIELNSDLPGIVTTFISEQRIRDVINREFDRLFLNVLLRQGCLKNPKNIILVKTRIRIVFDFIHLS